MQDQEKFFAELREISDSYNVDVEQFIEFMKERQVSIVEALKEYALWLDQEHTGRHYSPATINRKIAAAKSRIRYAFKHSSLADELRSKYQLIDIFKDVKLKQVEIIPISNEKILSVEEVRKLVKGTKDNTIKLMVRFLIGTGVRISEMLSLRLTDIHLSDEDFVEVRVVGKRRKNRIVHVKSGFIESVYKHFQGATYLFEHDGRPFNRISVTNRIKFEALRTIGREVTAQQLRHTWAVIQIRRGKDFRAVAHALGHSDPGLTMKMYSTKTLEPKESFLDIQETEQNGTVKAGE